MPEIVSSCSAATGLFKDKDNNYSSGTSNNSKSNHSNRAFKTESVAKTSGTTFSKRSVLPLSEHPANTVEPTPSKVPPVRMLTSSRGDRERLPGNTSDHGADEILRVKVEESREHAAGGSTAATFTNGNAW